MKRSVLVVFAGFSLFWLCACAVNEAEGGKHWRVDWTQTQENVEKVQAFSEMMAEETGSAIFAGIAGALATLSGALGFLARKQRRENKNLKSKIVSTVGVSREILDAYKQGQFFEKCNELEGKLQAEINGDAKGV